MAAGAARRHWKAITLGAVALLIVLGVGVPFIYIHVIEGPAPPPLSLSSGSPATTPSGGDSAAQPGIAGDYTVASGSTAGYRVNEVLAGQHTTAVGRTHDVTGTMTIAARRVTAAHFVVDMASVTSDRSQRDDQFRGRIMDVAQFPTATFTLTSPIRLASIPPPGTTITTKASGDLTLHGTTKPVTLTLHAERTTTGIEVAGGATISYGEFGIDNPSFGGFVSVGDSGAFEVLLNLEHQ
jgi:polyisoprenoid-binding protein YceI